MLGLYVDDLIAMSQDKAFLDSIVAALVAKYDIKPLGPVTRCLGINVHRSASGMFLEQTLLIDELLVKHKMNDCHAQASLIALDHKLYEPGDACDLSTTEMREIIGSLTWLASCTRPDTSFAVNLMARHLNAPNKNHSV